MSEKPMKTIVDCQTGIQTIEPMTDEEIANWNAIKEESQRLEQQRILEEQNKSEIKAAALAKLAALGLTEEEVKAITGN